MKAGTQSTDAQSSQADQNEDVMNNVVELNDVLVLSIENGRDFFLSVTVKFVPTMSGELCNGINTKLLYYIHG
jgi:hypothetical protein